MGTSCELLQDPHSQRCSTLGLSLRVPARCSILCRRRGAPMSIKSLSSHCLLPLDPAPHTCSWHLPRQVGWALQLLQGVAPFLEAQNIPGGIMVGVDPHFRSGGLEGNSWSRCVLLCQTKSSVSSASKGDESITEKTGPLLRPRMSRKGWSVEVLKCFIPDILNLHLRVPLLPSQGPDLSQSKVENYDFTETLLPF